MANFKFLAVVAWVCVLINLQKLATATCYNHDGLESKPQRQFPCDPNAAASHCCLPGDICYSNGLCAPGPDRSDKGVAPYYYNGCTAADYKTSACFSECISKVDGNALQVCPDLGSNYYCCFGTNGCNCTQLDLIVIIPSGTIMTSIPLGTRSSTSGMSSISSTSSSSTISPSTSSPSSSSSAEASSSPSSSTTSAAATTTSSIGTDDESSGQHKSNGVAIGVGVGVGVVVAALIVVGGIVISRKGRRQESKKSEQDDGHNLRPPLPQHFGNKAELGADRSAAGFLGQEDHNTPELSSEEKNQPSEQRLELPFAGNGHPKPRAELYG